MAAIAPLGAKFTDLKTAIPIDYQTNVPDEKENIPSPTNSIISGPSKYDGTEEPGYRKLKMGSFDVWALGITVVIGGQYFSWNIGLTAGFGTTVIALFFISNLYFCLVLCNSELCSAFPFTGGAYGLGRLTLGMYGGFIVACCEAVEYIFYVASSTVSLSQMIVDVTHTSEKYTIVYSLTFYVIALFIHIQGGKLFKYTNIVLAIISLGILLIYCFGSLAFVNFDYTTAKSTTGSDNESYFIGGIYAFLKIYPIAAWYYVGIESLNLATAYISDARKEIPKGAIACQCTLIATSIFVVFVCSSLPPDDNEESTAESLLPFNSGFQKVFKISYRLATALSIPATFATSYGFIFAYGRLIVAMARSHLFPPILKLTYGPYNTPYMALLAGSLMGYSLCVLVYFVPVVSTYLFNISVVSGFFEYICQFLGYILFRLYFDDQERSFRSPLGIFGAIYGMIVTMLGIICVIAFQDDHYAAIIVFAALFTIYTAYYFLYAKYVQIYSEEEKFLYYKCHVRGFNQIRRRLSIGGDNGTVLRRNVSPDQLSPTHTTEQLPFSDKQRAVNLENADHLDGYTNGTRGSGTKRTSSMTPIPHNSTVVAVGQEPELDQEQQQQQQREEKRRKRQERRQRREEEQHEEERRRMSGKENRLLEAKLDDVDDDNDKGNVDNNGTRGKGLEENLQSLKNENMNGDHKQEDTPVHDFVQEF